MICGLSSYFVAELKHEVEIISINSFEGSAFYPLDELVQIRHCGLDWRKQTFRKLLSLVGDVLSALDADILLTCHPTISYSAALKKKKFRGCLIITQHSACDSFSKKRLYCNAALFRFADQFVVLTESDRRIYQKLGCSSIVIPNANYRPAVARASLEDKRILAAGRMETVKGFDMLIEAFSKVSQKHPDWDLCICGGGSQEDQLRAQTQSLGLSNRVQFPGSVRNMQDYFQSASIFALSSRSEGFSLVLVEAIAFGLPVVSFDLPAAGEILGDRGGMRVLQGDVCAFADKLDMLMSDMDLRKSLGDEALQVSRKYTIPEISAYWMRLFEELLAK